MVLIRHKRTKVELDVPPESIPYYPEFESVESEAPAEDKSQRGRKAAEPTTTEE